MKYLLTLAALILLGTSGLQAQANAIDKYFQSYVDDERFTVVYISAKVFQLIDKLELGDMEIDDDESALVKDLAKDLRGLRILTTEESAGQFYEEARRKINTSEYETLMTVRQKGGDNVDFLIVENASGIIEELLLLAGGEDSFTLLSFVGKIDLEKVARLAKEMEKNEK